MGDLKLAPDNKIYLSMCYVDTFGTYFPYLPTMYNSYNMNLSVINSPDSAGLLCDFQPWSFYLGGKSVLTGAYPTTLITTYPYCAGSPCDTLVGIGEALQIQQAALNVFYYTAWEKAFINASNIKGKTGKLLVYDMQGKMVHSEPLRIQNGYYTRDLSMAGYATGAYIVVIQTEGERLTKKLTK
ncbi:MAG: T9SS type A sorting domain-containing protein [Bacteroidetes bacterium]|nr:T9SS type A sorting domain-containing protein [Bacteroidota bacterium]